MKQLINQDYSINPHEFFLMDGKNKGKKLRIISTKSNGGKVSECIDIVKNIESGNTTTVTRSVLKQMKPYLTT